MAVKFLVCPPCIVAVTSGVVETPAGAAWRTLEMVAPETSRVVLTPWIDAVRLWTVVAAMSGVVEVPERVARSALEVVAPEASGVVEAPAMAAVSCLGT